MSTAMGYLVVFFGAGIGGMFRHAINQIAPRFVPFDFPYGTMVINILGSLFMGVIAGYFALRNQAPQTWRLFLTTGILGGFTTFSAFSLESVLLYEKGQSWAALAYVSLTLVLAIGALFCGLAIARFHV